MRFISYTFLILVLFIYACDSSTEPSTKNNEFDVASETAVLNSLYSEYANTMMEGDIELARSIVADEFKLYSADFPMMTKDSWLNDFFPTFMPGNMVTITTQSIVWKVTPSLAISTTEDYWEWADETNIPPGVFCATTVYDKSGGSWKIVQLHFTPKVE